VSVNNTRLSTITEIKN